MRIFEFIWPSRRKTAEEAKERLQILLAHERSDLKKPDQLPMLQQELLKVISKYFDVHPDKVEVKLDRGRKVSTLEVNIELPGAAELGPRLMPGPAAAAAGSVRP